MRFCHLAIKFEVKFKRGELAARYLSQNSLKLTAINDDADVNLKTKEQQIYLEKREIWIEISGKAPEI